MRAPKNDFYVSSVISGVINEYDANGGYVRTILQPPAEETLGATTFSTGTPLGLGVGPDGTLYYADIGITITSDGIGPGPEGTVRRIRFVNGQPQPPETMGAGLQYPDGIGVCNACHAPTVPFDTDLRSLSGDAVHGVHCDFCHKIAKASTERIGFTHGRYGLQLLRPPHPSPSPPGGEGRVRGSSQGQIFFGPLDDVDRGEDSYSPLYHESRYCASCHEGVIFGVPVYTTYSEWLASPARTEGKQCQSCHMTPTGTMTNIAPGKGGRAAPPRASARLPGGQRPTGLPEIMAQNPPAHPPSEPVLETRQAMSRTGSLLADAGRPPRWRHREIDR